MTLLKKLFKTKIFTHLVLFLIITAVITGTAVRVHAGFWLDDFSTTNYIQNKIDIGWDKYSKAMLISSLTNVNLAYLQTVQASSIQDADYPAEEAVDGILESSNNHNRWASQSGSDDEWFKITFNNEIYFNLIYIKWENARALKFKVKVSLDDSTYETVYIENNNTALEQFILLDSRKKARYLLLDLDQRLTAYGYSIMEIQVFNIAHPDDGIIDASSSESGHPANDANDADAETRWASAAANNEYILFGMYNAKAVKGVNLFWKNPRDKYRIDKSDDGLKWTTIYENNIANSNVQEIILDSALWTRYIRMYGIEGGNFSLFEFGIHLAQFQPAGTLISQPIAPSDLKKWQQIYYSVILPGNTGLAVYVFPEGADYFNNSVALISDFADKQVNALDISSINAVANPSLVLKAVLQTGSPLNSPVLQQWGVLWSSSSDYLKIKDFQIKGQSFNITENENELKFILDFDWSNPDPAATEKYLIYRSSAAFDETDIFSGNFKPYSSLSKNKKTFTDVIKADKDYYYSLAVVDTNGYLRLSNNTISLSMDLTYNSSWIWVPSNWIWVEGENFLDKDGGGDDYKTGASAGICLGSSFSGWAVYDATTRKDMANANLYLRYATLASPRVSIYLDDIAEGDPAFAEDTLDATADWNEFDYQVINIGQLSAGIHKIKIDPDANINFDGFYLYDGLFTPDNKVENGILDPPAIWRQMAIKIEKNISLNKTQIEDARDNPFINNSKPVISYRYSVEGNSDAYFIAPVLIRLYFNQDNIPGDVDLNKLAVFYWDSRHWVRVGGELTTLYDSYYIATSVNHFSTFAVFESSGYELEEPVKWSYNPFSPNNDGICDASQLVFRTFKTGNVTIKIFDLKGKLVRTLLEREVGRGEDISIEWDGRDEENRIVATGIYVYQVEAANIVEDKNVIHGTIIVTK